MKKGYIFSVSGVRGIWGDTLLPDDVFRIVFHFVKTRTKKSGEVFVGMDGRVTGNALKGIVYSAILSAGYNVRDLGILPTPTFLFNVKEMHGDGGIMITASHNPVEWNGLKLVSSEGVFITKTESDELKKRIEEDIELQAMATGRIIKEDKEAIDRHIEKIISSGIIDVDLIKSSQFTVVTDTVNASSSIAIPELLKRLGCKVRSIHKEQTGLFERSPEPIPENLKELEKEIKKFNAIVGMAIDPDGDRLSLVSNEGEAIGEEYTLPIAAMGILDKINGAVINYSTSSLLEYVLNKEQLPVYRAPVGEANVVEKMKEKGINFGGEGNGGVILPKINATRDSLVGAALVLNTLAKKGKTVSEIKRELPPLVMIKNKYPLKKDLDLSNFEKVLNPDKIEKEDGYRFILKNGWIHIRKSNTEPIIRVIAEFNNIDEMNKYIKIIEGVL